jgi:hypothetical protein
MIQTSSVNAALELSRNTNPNFHQTGLVIPLQGLAKE